VLSKIGSSYNVHIKKCKQFGQTTSDIKIVFKRIVYIERDTLKKCFKVIVNV
jgi:hypothetical protein